MSDPHSDQQKIWAEAKARLEREPTAENYAKAYDAVNSFLRDCGDPEMGRAADGTIYGGTGSIEEWEKKLIVLLAGEPKKSVMEMGCGDGRMSRALAEKGATVKATDISEVAIGVAKKFAVKNTTFAVGNALELDEPSGQYDYATSCDMMEHLHPTQVPIHLSEVCRILKSGGAYIISVPRWAPPGKVDPLHLGNYHPEDMILLLQHAGFKVKPAAQEVLERTHDLDVIFGPPKTLPSKVLRSLSRLPGLNQVIGKRAIKKWCGDQNFFYARKP